MASARPAETSDRATMVLAALACVVVEAARSEYVFIRAPHWCMFAFWLVATALLQRQAQSFARAGQRKLHAVAGWSMAAFVGLAALQEPLFRSLGWGQDLNFAMLTVLRNLMLVLAAIPISGFAKMSAAMSMFLVLGGMALTNSPLALGAAAAYSMLGVWWLLGMHWESLEQHFPASVQRRTPRGVRMAIVGITLVATLTVATFAWQTPVATSLRGFLPFSGGESGNDPYATRGVNDGEQSVAAEKDADSFGAVESEVFLESEMQSLYDLMNDMYGEAKKKKESKNRAVALSMELKPKEHQHTPQSESASKEFSTVRRHHERQKAKRFESKQGDALLHVHGRVPLHLKLQTFEHFDGLTWTHDEDTFEAKPICLEEQGKKPWMSIGRGMSGDVRGSEERHLLKLIRMRSNRIPMPAHCYAWHIDHVDKVDMFGMTSDGCLAMPGNERVPPLTVIHQRSHTVHENKASFASDAGTTAKWRQIPATLDGDRLRQLASEVVSGSVRESDQIAAIVQHLKTNFILRSSPSLAEHPLEDFVYESHEGPDYLFATSAALMLRSLGFPTRVATGLYASPERYEVETRSTAVLPSDVHFWVEVQTTDGHWLTVDPSPGYEVLAPPLSWWQRILQVTAVALRMLLQHPLTLSLAVAMVALMYVGRKELSDHTATFYWWLLLNFRPQAAVLATIRLLESRSATAGYKRPSGRPIARHYLALSRPSDSSHELTELIRVSCRALYEPRHAHGMPHETALCRAVGRQWSVAAIRRAATSSLAEPQMKETI